MMNIIQIFCSAKAPDHPDILDLLYNHDYLTFIYIQMNTSNPKVNSTISRSDQAI